MFGWLSNLRANRVGPGDLGTLQKAIEALFDQVGVQGTAIARIERKVYRDLAKGNGDPTPEEVQAAFQPAAEQKNIEDFGPGEQIPPGQFI